MLVGSLGYPEEDSLTVALERARVAALDAACSRFEASRADLKRARRVLRAALGDVRTNVTTRASCDASSTAVRAAAARVKAVDVFAFGVVFAKRFFNRRWLTQNEICAKA